MNQEHKDLLLSGVEKWNANRPDLPILQDAKLRNTNLRYANLQDANLRYANLQYANLQNANLQNAKLPAGYFAICGLTWPVYIMENQMRIGCEQHSFEEWAAFSNKDIDEMDSRALDFWQRHRTLLLNLSV